MKKGFTLVELLAVIVVLAVVLAIAIPSVSGLINNSTSNAFSSDAKMVIKAINYKKMMDSSFDVTTLNETNIESNLGISVSNYQSISVTTLKGEPYVVIVGKNKWANLLAYGIYMKIRVTDSSNYTTVMNQLGYDEEKSVNEPKLAKGMTPIKWDGSKWLDTTENDPNWYNYTTSDKKWANVRTTDGSMWVWIPRYIYKISTGWHSNTTGTIDIQFSKGTDDNWNSLVIGDIDTGTTSNASNNKYTNHPGFDFGSTKINGIWVAKFESTASEGVANGYTVGSICPIAEDNVATKTIKILPNVRSWRCMTIGNAFTASRNMETSSVYGWVTTSGLQANGTFTIDTNNIDTHLIKNTEWGSVAYLSKSQYGQNTNEIYINNNQNHITGCAGNTASSSVYNGCQNAYDTVNGQKASTTGNIYGIYDLSGSAWERVSAYVNNGDGNLNAYGSNVIDADSKYKDIYTVGGTDDIATNYGLTINHKGDAVYETSNSYTGSTSWFGEFSSPPYTSKPWILRSGDWDNGSNAGAFVFSCTSANSDSRIGFRPVLAVGVGL